MSIILPLEFILARKKLFGLCCAEQPFESDRTLAREIYREFNRQRRSAIERILCLDQKATKFETAA